MTIYLYVKTHTKTGLKYLGKTTKSDPHKYAGSGKIWLRHLKKHGYEYTTDILLATEDNQELIETGLFFSKIWNVVESKEWANLIVESGDGIDSETAKKENKRRIHNKTHHWQGDGSFQRNIQKKRLENGTHPFLGGDMQRRNSKKQIEDGTHNFFFIDRSHVSKNNKKMVEDGTHPFLGSELNKRLLSEGRHTSQRPESLEKIKTKLKKRIEDGSHNFLGKTCCINKKGETVSISKEEYSMQTGPSDERDYVHVNSKEGKKRKSFFTPELSD